MIIDEIRYWLYLVSSWGGTDHYEKAVLMKCPFKTCRMRTVQRLDWWIGCFFLRRIESEIMEPIILFIPRKNESKKRGNGPSESTLDLMLRVVSSFLFLSDGTSRPVILLEDFVTRNDEYGDARPGSKIISIELVNLPINVFSCRTDANMVSLPAQTFEWVKGRPKKNSIGHLRQSFLPEEKAEQIKAIMDGSSRTPKLLKPHQR